MHGTPEAASLSRFTVFNVESLGVEGWFVPCCHCGNPEKEIRRL